MKKDSKNKILYPIYGLLVKRKLVVTAFSPLIYNYAQFKLAELSFFCHNLARAQFRQSELSLSTIHTIRHSHLGRSVISCIS